MQPESQGEKFARQVARLLQEYATKLDKELADLRASKLQAAKVSKVFIGSPEHRGYQIRFQHLQQALHRATREASQLAEQGDVEDGTKMALRLRLADVEGLLALIDFTSSSP
jgi:soluble cytochrome b562